MVERSISLRILRELRQSVGHGKAQLDRRKGQRRELADEVVGQQKASKEAKEREPSTTLMRPAMVIGGRNLAAQVQKTISTSASWKNSKNIATGGSIASFESFVRDGHNMANHRQECTSPERREGCSEDRGSWRVDECKSQKKPDF